MGLRCGAGAIEMLLGVATPLPMGFGETVGIRGVILGVREGS